MSQSFYKVSAHDVPDKEEVKQSDKYSQNRDKFVDKLCGLQTIRISIFVVLSLQSIKYDFSMTTFAPCIRLWVWKDQRKGSFGII